MIELKTLARGSAFKYVGSIKEGVNLFLGNSGHPIEVLKGDLDSLLKHFSNKTVPIEATRTKADLQEGSLGYWLNKNVNGPVITSYIASILVHEGYAEYIDKKLKFITY